jgi:glucose-1-phosphate cytidylyltransferase
MKTVILSGGMGTRLSEETAVKPKPLVEIGERPILWHIMKHYAHYGFKEFFVALGYKGDMIKRYFLDYKPLNSSFAVDLKSGNIRAYSESSEDWTVHLMDTGEDTLTGGRVKRLDKWLQDETFMVTYGDGVSDVNLHELLDFHRSHGRLATVTAVRPPARYGGIVFDGDLVAQFTEKPQIGEGWINGGFLVLEPGVFEYLKDDDSSLEVQGLEHLAEDGQIAAYRHQGFWQCMDTLRELRILRRLWNEGKAPWKVWQ